MRCDCGTWVEVPRVEAPAAGGVRRTARRGAFRGDYVRRSRRPVPALPLDPGVPAAPVTPAALADAPPATQRQWIDRSVLELAAILVAFLGPGLVLELAASGPRQALLLPFAGVVSGLLVLLVGLGSAPLAFGALRGASPVAFVEAAGVACGLAALALGWSRWLEGRGYGGDWLGGVVGELGIPLALFTVGLLPAVFEELAFRGLVLGRLLVLCGRTLGIVLAGVAFALAHGVTLGFPFHVALGLYLGWLRVRTGSLFPGMLTHLAYNGILVVAFSSAAAG
jgi:membrane protease YdiL (CAAX protease family)